MRDQAGFLNVYFSIKKINVVFKGCRFLCQSNVI